MHLGVVLPNYGGDASPAAIRRVAEAAEELGYDSVWATEHIIVGPEGVERYGRVYDPFVTLSWIAGWTERIELGTSIVLLPLHNPIHVAKQAATLSDLSGRRVRLGIGVGWHEDEFRFMGERFAGRGRRADEGVAVMKALWAGKRSFVGEHWQFDDATFAPLPLEEPEIWIGGATLPAVRRARRIGAVWHPHSGVETSFVRDAMAASPGLRLIPRTVPERVDEFLELGAEGAVVMFPDLNAMRRLITRYR